MPKIHKVTYNGTASDTLGIFVTGSGTFNAAEFDVTAYQVPGRNGDVLIPNNRYKNIKVEYPAFIPGNFEARAQSIRNWMRSSKTYAEIVDDYDTDHFRLGMAVGVQEFQPANRNDAANFKLVFNCKPQRFLNTGKTAKTISSSTTVSNPTQFEALPLFHCTKITSSASLSVTNAKGTFTLTATAARNGEIYIDCETQNIYFQALNLNAIFAGDFPILTAGTNTITASGFTSLTMIPRWWEL